MKGPMSDTSADAASLYPPRPLRTELTDFFWRGLEERRLLILACQDCGNLVHYPRPVCSRCLSTNLAPREMSGTGTLYAYTVTLQAFHPYYADKLPYILALVELAEQPGVHLTTNLVNCHEDDAKIGMPVRLVWTEVAPGMNLPYFGPDNDTAGATGRTE